MAALTDHTKTYNFQDQYIALREKEKRLYSDAELRQLPFIAVDHPHYEEWLIRRLSSDKLVKYIRRSTGHPSTPSPERSRRGLRTLRILEIGCGNGWLANKLSLIPGTEITGYDINVVELQQAKRVFQNRSNLQFASHNPFQADDVYDLIVFAASIQYFSSPEEIINEAMKKLQPDGHIHIIDTHFYKPEDLAAARQRTTEYYSSLGFNGLSEHYFHHTLHALKSFNFQVLYNPHAAWNRLRRRKSPFHWICIKKS